MLSLRVFCIMSFMSRQQCVDAAYYKFCTDQTSSPSDVVSRARVVSTRVLSVALQSSTALFAVHNLSYPCRLSASVSANVSSDTDVLNTGCTGLTI